MRGTDIREIIAAEKQVQRHSGAQVREAEEVEGSGFDPIPFGLLKGLASERHQTRLLGMRCRPKLRKPLGKHGQHLFRILASLEAQQTVIGIPDGKRLALQARFHHVLEPLIQNEVQVHIGQQRTDDLPLPRTRLAQEQPAVMTVAR